MKLFFYFVKRPKMALWGSILENFHENDGRPCNTLFKMSLYPHHFGTNKISFQLLSISHLYIRVSKFKILGLIKIISLHLSTPTYHTFSKLLTTYITSKYEVRTRSFEQLNSLKLPCKLCRPIQ